MRNQGVLAHLDDLAAQYIRTRSQVGLVVGFLDGEQRFTKGYGRMHNDATTLLDAQTIYEIGSITKVLTGITLARLEREGRLGLEDTVAHYLPSTLNLPLPAQSITLRHLATHTSGLPRLPDNLDATMPNLTDRQDNPYVNYTVQDLYDCLSHIELRSKPGTQFAYSNLGMSLLGHILELCSGQPYEQLVASTICQPLELSDTVIACPAINICGSSAAIRFTANVCPTGISR